MKDIKTVEDVRNSLAAEFQKLVTKESTPAIANAASNLAGKIFNSIKLELEYNRMIGTTPHIDFIKTQKVEPKKLEEAK